MSSMIEAVRKFLRRWARDGEPDQQEPEEEHDSKGFSITAKYK